jgi:hypothetical protein
MLTDIIDRLDFVLAIDAIIDSLDWMSEDDFTSKPLQRMRVHIATPTTEISGIYFRP